MANGRSGFRARARQRGRTRRLGARSTTRTTRTTTIRDRGERGGAARYVLPALVVAGLAYLLWPKDARADNQPVTPPIVPPGPGPKPWPPGTPEATVAPAGTNPATGRPYNGLNVRRRPNPSSPLVTRNDAFRGQRIGIISVGHAEEGGGCPSCVWYEVMTPGGSVGFARAVDPQGQSNITPHDPLPQQRVPVPVPIGGTMDGPPGQDVETGGWEPLAGLMQAPPPPLINAFDAMAPYAAASAYSQARW